MLDDVTLREPAVWKLGPRLLPQRPGFPVHSSQSSLALRSMRSRVRVDLHQLPKSRRVEVIRGAGRDAAGRAELFVMRSEPFQGNAARCFLIRWKCDRHIPTAAPDQGPRAARGFAVARMIDQVPPP